jgi:hypothetical protein
MATEGKGSSESTSTGGEQLFSTADDIRRIAARNARAELNNDEQLTLFLKSWWSKTYNRPLKDPLLLSYTLEDLLYEFYDKVERRLAEEERNDQGEINQEIAKEQADLDWAEQMEQEDLANMKAKAANLETAKVEDPTKDPDNIKWMEEQMKLAKQQFGETFGNDIEEDFE